MPETLIDLGIVPDLADESQCNPTEPARGELYVRRDLDCAFYSACNTKAAAWDKASLMANKSAMRGRRPQVVPAWRAFTCERCNLHDPSTARTVPISSGGAFHAREPADAVEALARFYQMLRRDERREFLHRINVLRRD